MIEEICKQCGQKLELDNDDRIKICAYSTHITLKGFKIEGEGNENKD
jgi:Fe2+ or Zn2+ uptake regulation protein